MLGTFAGPVPQHPVHPRVLPHRLLLSRDQCARCAARRRSERNAQSSAVTDCATGRPVCLHTIPAGIGVFVVRGRRSAHAGRTALSDVAHRADRRFMLGAEFGRNRRASAVGCPEVMPPYFVQQLREHPAGMLRQVFRQLELFVGEIQRAATRPGGVGAFVDHQLTPRLTLPRLSWSARSPRRPRPPAAVWRRSQQARC